MRSAFIALSLSLAAPVASQIAVSIDAVLPIRSTASVSGRPTTTSTIPAGRLHPMIFGQTATASDLIGGVAEASFRIDTDVPNSVSITSLARVNQAFGSAGNDPIELQVVYQIPPALTNVALRISSSFVSSGLAGGSVGLDTDDNGSFEISSVGGTADMDVTVPVRVLNGLVRVRVSARGGANRNSDFSHVLQMEIVPSSDCLAIPLGTGGCDPLVPVFVGPNFSGGIDYLLGAQVPTTTFLVLGVNRLGLPIPSAGPSNCILDPSPEVILPMSVMANEAMGVIPALPRTSSGFEFFAQPVALDFASGDIETFPSYRVVCR